MEVSNVNFGAILSLLQADKEKRREEKRREQKRREEKRRGGRTNIMKICITHIFHLCETPIKINHKNRFKYEIRS